MVKGWIYDSVSMSMLGYMSSGIIARIRWVALEEFYSTYIQSKVMDLRQQLQGLRKVD